jgi:NAD(P)-dependent dehydrogenase (short-subunit alcohol dehydrogenase family)
MSSAPRTVVVTGGTGALGCAVVGAFLAAGDRVPPAGLAAYAAAKAGVLVLTEVLQREVEGDGVRVCALLPSTIDTPANRAAMPDADFSRWTSPAQIADVLVWLASEAAAPLRGALVPV